jgi:glycosyltransferase involved in cell wall biosynthesis
MTPKKILHLYSNHKWTGPADHALNLVGWLQTRAGVEAYFACGRRKGVENPLYEKSSQRRLDFVNGLQLKKHLSWELLPDVFALRKIVARRRINLIHCHQDNDALTAALAGCGSRMIRTCYDGDPAPLNFRQRYFYRQSAKIMTASVKLQEHLASIFPDKDIQQVNIPVDLERFQPFEKSARLQSEFGLKPDDPVGGIVARVQKHRNFSQLLEAVEQVVKLIPDFKFLIVGRGTHIDTVAREPVHRRGLEKNIIFTGYRRDDYRDVLNLFDYKIFLVPGSDGSCRAVREALACGKPVIAARKGILPELIGDGKTGLLVNGKPEDLARAVLTMTRDRDLRLRCSRAARQYAETVLSPDRYVQKVTDCYNAVLEST